MAGIFNLNDNEKQALEKMLVQLPKKEVIENSVKEIYERLFNDGTEPKDMIHTLKYEKAIVDYKSKLSEELPIKDLEDCNINYIVR